MSEPEKRGIEPKDVINCPECQTRVKYLPGGFCPACAFPLDATPESAQAKSKSDSEPIYVDDRISESSVTQPQGQRYQPYDPQNPGLPADAHDYLQVPSLEQAYQSRGIVWVLFGFEGRIPRRIFWAAILGTGFVFYVAIFAIEANRSTASVVRSVYDSDPYLDDSGRGYGRGFEDRYGRYERYEIYTEELPWWANVLQFGIYVLMIWTSMAISMKRYHDIGKSGWWYWVILIPCVGGLILLIENGFVRGTFGHNAYGPDPT